MMEEEHSRASLLFMAFYIFAGILIMLPAVAFAQDENCSALMEENRKLASALADATGRILDNNGGSGAASCAGIDEIRAQNESLRATIKAQNEVMVSGGNVEASVEINKLREENEALRGLKETVRQLQAQNEHLSSAGNMGKTIANQVIILQERVDELRHDLEKEKQNASLYRSKLKEAEAAASKIKTSETCGDEVGGINNDQESLALSKKVTSLQLENQELKARIELLQQKIDQ